jgi:OCT family organic cation transporter-like MFS transporter 4/5
MIVTFTIGGILGMLIMAFPKTSLWARPILIILGKTVCSINFLGVGLLTKEVFPTSVRNGTYGMLDACSKLGAAIAPFLVELLSLIDAGLPNLVIGALTISAVIPFFFLPETSGQSIPESIPDMKRLTHCTLVAKCCKKSRRRKVYPISEEK